MTTAGRREPTERAAGWIAGVRDRLQPLLLRDYRTLHEIPELAYEEEQTAEYLAGELRSMGLEPRTGLAGTGVAVELPHGGDGPTVMLRADMDGLPVKEVAEHEPRSRHEGRMHACGHDAHMAIALGAARAFSSDTAPAELPGRIVLVFQPAEETGAGARRLVDAGLLDELGVDYVLGLHLWSFSPLGEAIIPDGTVMASADEFHVQLRGPGGHGALPHRTRDVVLAASQLVVALQGIVARDVDPALPAVVTCGKLRAGDAPNVIPQVADIEGTFRAGDRPTRAQVMRRIGEVCEAIGRLYGVEVEVEYGSGYPPTVNHTAVASRWREEASALLGPEAVHAGPPAMASEDFSFYLQARPGAFCLLGMRDEEAGSIHPHHSPRFRVAESVLPLGLELMLRGALRLMEDRP